MTEKINETEDWAYVEWLFDRRLPMTAAQIAVLARITPSMVHRRMKGVRAAREQQPKTWAHTDIVREFFGA